MPTWTAENDLKLASAIIALHQVKVSKDDCDRLATIMGEDCTAKAITHRVAKLRETATKLGLTGGGGATAAAAPATPPTQKKRGRKTKVDEDQAQDGEGVPATPTKKARTPKTKKSSAFVKDEVEQEEEIVKKDPVDEEQIQADA